MPFKYYECPFQYSERDFLSLSRKFSEEIGTVLLHSGSGYPDHQVSYLGVFPKNTYCIEVSENPWEDLKDKLRFFPLKDSFPKYMGYLSYEMGAFSHLHRRLPIHKLKGDLACFYEPSVIYTWNRKTLSLSVHLDAGVTDASLTHWEYLKEEKLEKFSLMKKKKSDRDLYQKAFHCIKKHLLRGDIYQVCLSTQEEYQLTGSEFSWYTSLLNHVPMPYTAYIKTEKGVVISLSPERFLKKEGAILKTEPIKGTVKRDADSKLDKEAKDRLVACPKNTSELVMITDLMRNDLSQVSKIGSVKVENEKVCEKYPYVWHLKSEIVSEVKNNVPPLECLQACFPPGSISGCPKLKAQEIIFQQEQRSRGPYTGAIGYFTSKGDFDFNVAIRTAWSEDKNVCVQSGGAILVKSDLNSEWEEIQAKMEGLIKVTQC